MMKIDSTLMCACFALLSVSALGCSGDDDEAAGEMIASSQNAPLFVYGDPYAPMMAGVANPIGNTASATAFAFDEDGSMRIELNVLGFPASRPFGSHLHRLPCDDMAKAGTHYQNMPFPTGGSATDATYANATNEAWLDFTTDAQGAGSKVLTVDWLPRAGEAKGIIIHDMLSGVGGVSGAKLACLPIAF
ncbi:MAG: hypothetical protein RL685_298 [Pseudomonadota bacterium]|jgi:Cu-Zn family superoxide dismutase